MAIVLLTGATAAALYSLTLQRWFASRALFFIDVPPAALSNNPVLGLASQFGLSGIIGGGPYSSQYYSTVLQSNQVLDPIALGKVEVDSSGRAVALFAPRGSATPQTRDQARNRLASHFSVLVDSRTNTIGFSIEAPSQYAAKAAADSVVASLDRVIVAQRQKRASLERRFLEERLDSALVRQNLAEDLLRRFYVHNRIISSPDLRFEEVRLKRAADFAVELSTQLRSQLEQARLQEVRGNPAVTLISAPEIPGRKSRPNRRFMVLGTVLVLGLLCFAWAAIEVAFQRGGLGEGQRHSDG